MSAPHVARAELVLASDPLDPLRELALRPDPLASFARAFGKLREDLGESAAVAIDLLPVAPRRRRRLIRELSSERKRRGAGAWDQVRRELKVRPQTSTPAPRGEGLSELEALERRDGLRARARKLLGAQALFEIQVLIRASSEIDGRAQAHVKALVACFEQFAHRNHLRVAGRNLGLAFLGADATPWSRRRFDRRFTSGLLAPARTGLVSAPEIAAFLKPPTKHCPEQNVTRSGGVIPPPPRGLPEFARQRDLLPLGRLRTSDGAKLVGVHLKDTFFSYVCGRSRFGKTELAINQFIHLARAGHGCFFLDPAADALNRIKPYLTDISERVIEINLAPRGVAHRQAAWNLFSMAGRTPEEKEALVSAVVDSFASALRWGEINNRALTLTTMAAQSLVELSEKLPKELAPTIFQMTTLLASDEWREAVLGHLSVPSRDFWESRFPRLSAEATTPVTNLIDRLRSSVAVSALLGSSVSSYDVRTAMDTGKVVLACPAGNGDKDRLVANFLVYDVLRAALSRKDTPPDLRRPFFAFFDEVQTYDGASRGHLAGLLEQSGKYGLRAFLLNQNPERLTPQTLDAVMTNRSHLATTVVNARAAALIAGELGRAVAPETLTRLQRFSFVASATLGQEVTRPFLVRGVPVEELWSDCHRPDQLGALDEAIDKNLARRPVGETLADLETLDQRILEYLEQPLDPQGRGGAGLRADHVRFVGGFVATTGTDSPNPRNKR